VVVLAAIVEARRKLEYELRGQQQKVVVNIVKSRSLPTRSGEAVILVRLWSVPSKWPT